jgi:regulation of enolase protein 1 (concanavalin A-like superfamily)
LSTAVGVVCRSVIAGLSYRWLGDPCGADAAGDRLTLAGRADTDFFVDPRGTREPRLSAPALVTAVAGDFVLVARVEVDFAAAFDGGGLLAHVDGARWGKLCFECSPEIEPGIVSVVTRGLSDDCNSWPLTGGHAWLRIARIGGAFAFHAREDGGPWRLVRHFSLEPGESVDAGFVAQSPHGAGCEVRFTEIGLERTTLADIRAG